MVGGLLALEDTEEAEAKERRRRKQRHRQRKSPGPRRQRCRRKSKAQICAGRCGTVKSRKSCGKQVDCGLCLCSPPCDVCFICQEPQSCAIDPEQQGQACGSPGQICQPDGACACDAASCPASAPLCVSGICEPCTSREQCGEDALCVDGACHACDVTCESGTCTGAALQQALDNPGADAAVYVCPGIYTGAFEVANTVTVVGSGDGEDPLQDTILDAEGSGRVVLIGGGLTVEMHSLRIRGGEALDGGGLRNADGSTVTLEDCTITGNTSSGSDVVFGGGVYSANSVTTLVRCTISHNTLNPDEPEPTGGGGGVVHRLGGKMTLTDCDVTGNSATVLGGGIYSQSLDEPVEIIGCRVSGNTTTRPLGGGGVACDLNATATLHDSYVWDNSPPDCFGDVTVTGVGGCAVAPP